MTRMQANLFLGKRNIVLDEEISFNFKLDEVACVIRKQ